MKRPKTSTPPREFTFAEWQTQGEPFRLVPEETTDGQRIMRQKERAIQARIEAEKRQMPLNERNV